jgi:hypothetical protein
MILISGDGGSGTSVLVWLLRDLGFSICPKGYEQHFQDLPSGEPVLYELLREQRIRDAIARGENIQWPDVIKHLGGFCFGLHDWVDRFQWKVDLVLICTRGLEEGIRRRWAQDKVHQPDHKFLQVDHKTFCGLNRDQIDERARKVVRERIGAAVLQCIDRDYPYAILPYPKFAEDPKILYGALQPILKDRHDFASFYNIYSRRMVPGRTY